MPATERVTNSIRSSPSPMRPLLGPFPTLEREAKVHSLYAPAEPSRWQRRSFPRLRRAPFKPMRAIEET
jgi:hypothetical protein